jgi:hypothetical protein
MRASVVLVRGVALRLALSLATIIALAGAPAYAQRRVALVIGNGAYMHVAPLANPERDAAAIGEALRRLQFEHVTVLQDLGATALRKALLDFEPQAADADIAMIYFAGHGIEVDGQNFLIPIDARLARAAATELEAIPLATVTTVLGAARKLRLVILDACRDNPFRRRMAADSGRKRSIGRGLSRVEPGENELIVYAAAAGTEAADGSGRHSPFTAALLTHIETPGLDVRIMLGKVRDEVLAATGRQQALTSPPQQPLYVGPPGAWVKLCDKRPVTGKDKGGRERKKAVDLCMTMHEQIHPDTRMTMVAARLSQTKVDGKEGPNSASRFLRVSRWRPVWRSPFCRRTYGRRCKGRRSLRRARRPG